MYDICFINFGNSDTDARINNMLSALLPAGRKILLISTKNSNIKNPNLQQIEIKMPNNSNLMKRWMKFNFDIFKMKVAAKYFLACEFYSLFIASILKKRCSASLVYDSREIYSALGSLANNFVKQKIITAIEAHLIKYVNKVIVTGELDKEYLAKQFGSHLEYFLIMNLPFFKQQIKSNTLRKMFNIDSNVKIILYQGWLLDGRGISTLLQVMKNIKNYALIIMGDGEQKNKFKMLASQINKNNIFFLDAVPYDELHLYTCSADIGTALFEPISASYNLALPNKLFEYAMAEIPIIATNLPAIKNIHQQFDFGKLIAPDLNIDDIQNAIYEIENNFEYYSKNLKMMKNTFNYDNQTNILNQIFIVN